MLQRKDSFGNLICADCGQPILEDQEKITLFNETVHKECMDHIDSKIEDAMLRRHRK